MQKPRITFNFNTFVVRAGLVLAALAAVYLLLRLSPYPELEAFLERPFSAKVYDRNGYLLQIVPLKDGLRREYVPLDALQKTGAEQVFIAAEDKRFYWHFGVDALSVVRAAFQNLLAGRRVSGASTITMQLARIISGGGGGSFGGKAAEALDALRLETRFSKKEILEMYLNSTPFGFQTEGLASASRSFFAVEADMLSPARLFCLAVIPRRPSLYSPLQNQAECKKAAAALQKRFAKSPANRRKFPALASITDADLEAAVNSAERFDYPFEAPHLVRHVLSGKPQTEVRLSVDIRLQRHIEALIAENTGRHGAERVNQGAAVILDNGTGEVLAWVGSADFSGGDGGQIDGVLAPNQPGSGMKPFLYALALERGIAPASVLADVPASFGGEEIYIPQNFNNRFNGPVLPRRALASSLNIPAVELLYRLGVKDYAGFLSRLGFDSLGGEEGSESSGLGLALGSAPVSLLELARAFSAFPNDGKPAAVRFFFRPNADEALMGNMLPPLSTARLRGEVSPLAPKPTACPPPPSAGGWWRRRLPRNSLLPGQRLRLWDRVAPLNAPATPERVFSPDTARVICSFLSDSGARYLGFGRARNFTADFPMIVKTGTANQYQSITALAASRRFTGAVWMGNFSGETVIGRTGSSVPAAIVRDSLVFLHKNYPPERQISLEFEEPAGFVKRRVCAVSGLSPTEACEETLYEYTDPASPPPPCGWHRIENGRVTVSYPARFQSWLLSSRREGFVEHGGSALDIVSPRDGFVFFAADGSGAIPVEVIGGSSDELEVFYDGSRSAVRRPFKFFLPLERGGHTLAVNCAGERREVEFTVE